jgi:hypothetical protein
MMRKLVFILILSLLSFAGFSQAQPDEYQQGGFCTINGQFFSVEKGMSITIGGSCGFIVKDFRIGAYFDGMSKAARIVGTDSNPYSLRQSHGGIYFGYPFFNDHSFHLVTDIKVGYGSSALINAVSRKGFDRAGFVAIVPSAAVEYSITDILKISLGINYQFHIKVKTPELYKQSVLNAPGVYLALTLGLF